MHTSAMANLFLLVSAFEGVRRLREKYNRSLWPGAVAPLMLVACISYDTVWITGDTIPGSEVSRIEKIVGRDSVTCSRRISYHFSRRPEIRFYQHGEPTRWVILDQGAAWEKAAFREYYRMVESSPDYALADGADGGLKVYRLEQ
jgi:hypothetical protein